MTSNEDWGVVLTKMIARTEARVANYKKIVTALYKKHVAAKGEGGDRELIDLFKSFEKDEMKFLKRLRKEKTYWNEGWWERIVLDRGGDDSGP